MATNAKDDRCGTTWRYPARVRDVAFQVWGFKCSRRWDCLHRELAKYAKEEGWECIPNERTLRYWSERDDWPAAVARSVRAIAPDVIGSVVADLIFGAVAGSSYLRDVIDGRIAKPSATRAVAAQFCIRAIGADTLAERTVADAIDAGTASTLEDGIGQTAQLPPSDTDVRALKDAIASRIASASIASGDADTDDAAEQ
jgi:hypothetical protein